MRIGVTADRTSRRDDRFDRRREVLHELAGDEERGRSVMSVERREDIRQWRRLIGAVKGQSNHLLVAG
jgi:hypothetical protein